MYDLLSQVKISVLDQERKEAKQRYQEALRAYVIQYFGRPLEKLNVSFMYTCVYFIKITLYVLRYIRLKCALYLLAYQRYEQIFYTKIVYVKKRSTMM